MDAGVIYRFVHQVASGDYVIYPSKHDRLVNIGKFTGGIGFEASGEDGYYATYRDVVWLDSFPRGDFSQSALHEIGSFITLFSVKKHASEFLAKINGEPVAPQLSSDTDSETEAPDDDSVSISITRQAEESAQDFVIRRIHTMLSGHEFEYFVGHLLECMGYTARVTQGSGDGGVDIIAHNDKLGFEPPIIKVQCKRTTNTINETQIRELLGTLAEGEFALFVTLGAYAKQARLSERNLAKLRLIDGEELFELIVKHYAALSHKYRTIIPLKQVFLPDL
ncbi:MAG: restriction endonuclease [Flavobacteriaceae bacterium]|nr:restriction endonuclease [Flavobacteriaceae bacterium]